LRTIGVRTQERRVYSRIHSPRWLLCRHLELWQFDSLSLPLSAFWYTVIALPVVRTSHLAIDTPAS
jgi:hypothetical protein